MLMTCRPWIKFLFSCLICLTPLIFCPFNSELFELPKMYFVYALTLIILALHLINVVNGHVPLFKHTFLDWPLLLFLLSQIISTIISIDPHTSFFGYYSRLNGGLLSIICYSLLYWILVVYIDQDFKRTLIRLSLICGLVVALYGILEHFGIDKNYWIQDVQNRVFSTLGQPNWLAAYLCLLLPFCFLSPNLLTFTLTIIFSFCLLFTKSKSGLIAAVISLLLCIRKNNFYYYVIFIIITSLFFLGHQSSPPPPSNLNITPSEDIRKIVWTGAIDLYKKYPLFGTGVETFAYTYYWTRPASHNLTSEWEFLYNKAHNEYFNYLATTGTVGIATYLFLILTVSYQMIKKRQFILLASYLSILITNFSGFSVVVTALFFYLLPAFIIDET